LKAKKYFEALQIIPDGNDISPNQLALRAHCNFKLGQYEKAEIDLDNLKEFKSHKYIAFNNKGYLYLEQFLFEKAISELRIANEISPKESFALNNLGFAFMLTGQVEEGVKMVEDSLKLNKHNYYAIRNIGVYHLLKKDYSKAITVFERAKRLDNTIDDIDNYISISKFYLENKFDKQQLTNNLSPSSINRIELFLKAFS